MPNNLIKLHLQGMKKMVFPYMYLKRLTKVHIFLKKSMIKLIKNLQNSFTNIATNRKKKQSTSVRFWIIFISK